MQRYRSNFQSGVASGITTSQTTITGSNWPTTIPSGQYLPATLNPGYFGASNTSGPEIVYVTSVTGNAATVLRGQEGTSGALVNGTVPWVSGPLVSDFTLLSGMNNGDFPVPTASGQILTSVGSGVISPIWTLPGLTALTINASGTNQATASLITTQYTVVNGATATASGQTNTTGVVLPISTVNGQYYLIDNNSNNWLAVYPNGTQSIDGAGNGNPIWLAPNAYWEGVVESTGSNGNWASFIPSFNSGAGINVAYGNGNITFSLAVGNLPGGSIPAGLVGYSGTNTQTGSYTVVSGDVNYLIQMNNTASGTLTIPSSSAFAIGQQITAYRSNTGIVAISGAAGVTIVSTAATATVPTLRAQYSVATAINIGTNSWLVTGDLA